MQNLASLQALRVVQGLTGYKQNLNTDGSYRATKLFPWSHEPRAARRAARAARIEARRPLKEEVEKLIAPYLSRVVRPPFTATELTTMALICSFETGEDDMTTEEVVRWIIDQFYYYRVWTTEDFQASRVPLRTRWISSASLEMNIDGKRGGFLDYGVPIYMQERCNNFEMVPTYSVESHLARQYLSKLLEPERKGAFRFLDLPPELQNRIYHLVLYFDDCEIMIDCKYKQKLHLSRPSCRSTQGLMYRSPIGQDRSRPLPKEVCSLLGVCREVQKVALPIFYGMNTFLFADLRTIPIELMQLYPSAISRIKKISITFPPYSAWIKGEQARAARALQKLPPLDELVFTIISTWFDKATSLSTRQLSLLGYGKLEELYEVVAIAAKAKKIIVTYDTGVGKIIVNCDTGVGKIVKGCKRLETFVNKVVAKEKLRQED